MSLSVDVWKKLGDVEPVLRAECGVYPEWDQYKDELRFVVENLRTLIDAARPRCTQCEDGNTYDPDAATVTEFIQGKPCPDCNGTGWAA